MPLENPKHGLGSFPLDAGLLRSELAPPAFWADGEGKVLALNFQGAKFFGAAFTLDPGQNCLDGLPWTEPSRAKLQEALLASSDNECELSFLPLPEIAPRWFVVTVLIAGPMQPRTLLLKERTLELALRKQASEADERCRRFFEASPNGVTVTDLETSCYIDVNEGFHKIFGYERGEVIGRPAIELGIWAYPEDRNALQQIVREKGRLRGFHAVGKSKDGSLKTCSISGECVDLSGRKALVLVVWDITEQLKTERALRDALLRFTKAFRSSPDAMSLCDLDSGRFVEVNAGFERLYGAARETIIGKDAGELDLYVDPAARAVIIERLLKEGTVRDHEVKIRRGDGEERIVLLAGELMEVDGRPHSVVIFRDVTEQRKAEELRSGLEAQLRQAQKLEALGILAGGIAHDFNNILTAIMAYTELSFMDADNPVEVRSNLAEIQKASNRAKDLVKQILSFSRRRTVESVPFRVGAALREAVKLLRSSIPSSILIKELGLEDDSMLVLGDASQLHQVLMNLGTNATHAMKGQPGVLVFSMHGTDDASGGASPGSVCIEVSDTGHGMSETVKARLFEPFFTTKPQGEGTGLGLSVVMGIVETHGGRIEVESEEGQGCLFRVFLPLYQGPVEERIDFTGELPHGAGERILFIDDEEQLCQMMQKSLVRLGYQVSTFTNPLEALALIVPGERDIDLVITDLTMPHLTGLDIAKRVKGSWPEVPVLLCSGLPGNWSVETLAAAGIDGILNKPLTVQILAFEIRRLLEGGSRRANR